MTKKTVGDLLQQYKSDPASLTIAEVKDAQRLIRRAKRAAQDRNPYFAEQQRKIRAASTAFVVREPQDPERIRLCENDLRRFIETYSTTLASGAYMPLADLHLTLIDQLQGIILHGGRQSIAAPRGTGKTTLIVWALLWALLYQHRRFVVYACENADLAKERLLIVKGTLERGNPLNPDFCYFTDPINGLDGKVQRASGQTWPTTGNPTRLVWRSDDITLPTRENNDGGGGRMVTIGLTAGVRGLLDIEGRPDLVIIDDPQGDEAAASPTQRAKRRKVISSALAHLGSQYSRTAMALVCSIIEEGDVADEFTDRLKQPSWSGLRYKFLETMPANEALWEQYIELRKDDQREGDRHARRAHQFYLDNREAMDAGAVCSLPYSYEGRHVIVPPNAETSNVLPDGTEVEASAIQRAFNVIADDGPFVFASEYQNDPLPEEEDAGNLTADELTAKVRNIKRGIVPSWCDTLTAAVDLHDDILFWLVAGWSRETFGGHIVDFGVWPRQPGRHFQQGYVKNPLKKQYPGHGKEAAIRAGLDALLGDMRARHFNVQDGSLLSAERVFVDSGYVQDLVFQAALESDPASVQPTRGVYVGAKTRPFGEGKNKRDRRETLGDCWREVGMEKYRRVRRVYYDANHWKTFVRERLATPTGDPGALSLPSGSNDLLIEHLMAERGIAVDAAGRRVTEWVSRSAHRDNHWWDCLILTAVAASRLGCAIKGVTGQAPRRVKRERVKLSELQRGR